MGICGWGENAGARAPATFSIAWNPVNVLRARPLIGRGPIDCGDLCAHGAQISRELAAVVDGIEVDHPEKAAGGLLGYLLSVEEELRGMFPGLVADSGHALDQLAGPLLEEAEHLVEGRGGVGLPLGASFTDHVEAGTELGGESPHQLAGGGRALVGGVVEAIGGKSAQHFEESGLFGFPALKIELAVGQADCLPETSWAEADA